VWLNIFDDGTYRVSYSEDECSSTSTLCQSNDPPVLTGGAWSITDGNLVLDGLGSGRRSFLTDYGAYPCWPAISFTYSTDLKSPGLVGVKATLIPTLGVSTDAGLF
jgi:hypothetical protein